MWLPRTPRSPNPLPPFSRPIPHDFGADGRYFYYTTERDSEFRYLARYDVETGGHETVLKPDWDVRSLSLSLGGGTWQSR